jgi:hypothetical protein
MSDDKFDKAYMPRWFESFVMFCDALPARVKVDRRMIDRYWLLSAAARLRAAANAAGELKGRRGTWYSERQLIAAVGRSAKTVRGMLHWFEESGWLKVAPTNRRAAAERRLVIPDGALVAVSGWPFREPRVGERSGSNDPALAQPRVGENVPPTAAEWGNSGPPVGERSRSTDPPPPGRSPVKGPANGDGSKAAEADDYRFQQDPRAPHGVGEVD